MCVVLLLCFCLLGAFFVSVALSRYLLPCFVATKLLVLYEPETYIYIPFLVLFLKMVFHFFTYFPTSTCSRALRVHLARMSQRQGQTIVDKVSKGAETLTTRMEMTNEILKHKAPHEHSKGR